MTRPHRAVMLISLVMLIVVLRPALPASAAQKRASEREIRVAGIMFDFDRKNNWMTVKADGEDEPVKYHIDPSERKLAEGLQTVFNASRVRLTYKAEGGSRRLVKIQRQILQESGTVTGVVVKVHNDFWIELKPKKGVADAFAPGANYNDKAFMAKLKALQPGDSVTIRFTTDFERHRILALRKNPAQAKPSPKSKQQGGPVKEED
ncbi:MAG: hypothetical protein ACLQGP_25080 [Isosphaeraceae bacterium]